jgi:copper homeostasis protein
MLEICIDSVASARAAAAGGAGRVELCTGLPEGGLTPSAGLLRAVRAVFPGKLMVLIRPRGGDFLYSDEETDLMQQDIETARSLGADGIAIGCLNPDGTVDKTRCRSLLEAATPLDVTFHRAFDMTRDLAEALDDILSMRIRRILTRAAAPRRMKAPASSGSWLPRPAIGSPSCPAAASLRTTSAKSSGPPARMKSTSARVAPWKAP